MTTAAKKVLVYRIGSLGDTIVALPSLHLVSRVFPNAERRMLTNFPVKQKAPPAAAILENTGLVHSYFRYSVGTRNLLDLFTIWWRIAVWRPDVLVYLGTNRGLASARRDRAFFRLCGIRRIVGVPQSEEASKNCVEADGALEYEAQRLARLISELGDARVHDPASWEMRLTDQEREKAEQVLQPANGRPLIAVSIGTKVQTNEWETHNWRALLERLAVRYPGHALVLLGAPSDREVSDEIAAGWCEATQDSTVLNLCGNLTPRESGAVLSKAQVFLGHDSGPMHLAAAVQTPCVAVFSARGKPRVWFPFGARHHVIYHQVDCWGCNLDTCIQEKKKCILSISVDEVLSKVDLVLAKS